VGARMAFIEPRGSSRGGAAPIPAFPQRGKEKDTATFHLPRVARRAMEN
jgi:hypothetical protein